MKTYNYNYGDDKIVIVGENTLAITPVTFNRYGSYFEPESISYFYNLVGTNNSSTILDIGAQSGLYTLYAKFLPNCTFIAYEPNPETFHLLKENCKLNGITNASLNNKGMGDSNSKLQLKIPLTPDEKGLCCFGDSPERFNNYYTIEVLVTTIDTEFFDKDMPVHFIKCDTEGWEPYIIKGGEKTIKKWKPEIFLEVNHTNLRQCNKTKKDLTDLLEGYGYRLQNIINDENYHYSYCI
jgi:FkbM family methyltransferase